ncbi:unnamed protein product [Lampetra fluviatilis]
MLLLLLPPVAALGKVLQVRRLAEWLCVLPRFLLSALMLFLLDVPCVRRFVLERMQKQQQQQEEEDPPLRISATERTFTCPALRAVWRGHLMNAGREARLGGPAPNSPVVAVRPDRRRGCRNGVDTGSDHLLDFSRDPRRPLVVEAHPSDGWRTGDALLQVPQHRTLCERLAAAKQLSPLLAPPCALVADGMGDACARAYGAAFHRLFVLHRGRVVYQGSRDPTGGRLADVRRWLEVHSLTAPAHTLPTATRGVVLRARASHHAASLAVPRRHIGAAGKNVVSCALVPYFRGPPTPVAVIEPRLACSGTAQWIAVTCSPRCCPHCVEGEVGPGGGSCANCERFLPPPVPPLEVAGKDVALPASTERDLTMLRAA